MVGRIGAAKSGMKGIFLTVAFLIAAMLFAFAGPRVGGLGVAQLNNSTERPRTMSVSKAKSKTKPKAERAVLFKYPRNARFTAETKPESRWRFERDFLEFRIAVSSRVKRMLLAQAMKLGVSAEELANVALSDYLASMAADSSLGEEMFGKVKFSRAERN